jgi:hypothetical protein
MAQGYSGQGKVYLGLRQSNGTPDLMRWIGNTSDFTIAQQEDVIARDESYSGNRSPFRRQVKKVGAEISFTTDEYSKENLALAMRALTTVVAAGTAVTGYVLPSNAVVGSIFSIPARNVTAVTLKDSTGSPKTLTLGTNYTLNAKTGTIELLDITAGGPFVQPFKVDYTPGAYTKLAGVSTPQQEYYIKFDGINTDSGLTEVVEVFRVKISVAKALKWILDDYQDFQFDATALLDTTKTAGGPDGQLYHVTPNL